MSLRSARLVWSFPIALSAIVAACGGAQPAAEAPPSSDAPTSPALPEGPEASSPEGAEAAPSWASLKTFEEKRAFMGEHVMPAMTPVFQGFDAQRYAKFTCMSCHKTGAQEGSFKMPDPGLPKLSPADFEKLPKESPKVFQFMAEHVTPEMTKVLGATPYDPQTHQGFGCGNCHVIGG